MEALLTIILDRGITLPEAAAYELGRRHAERGEPPDLEMFGRRDNMRRCYIAGLTDWKLAALSCSHWGMFPLTPATKLDIYHGSRVDFAAGF